MIEGGRSDARRSTEGTQGIRRERDECASRARMPINTRCHEGPPFYCAPAGSAH
jgi:hypothetical protein